MEALIKVPSSEFNMELFEKIKSFLKNEQSLEVTISIREKSSEFVLNESQEEYWNRLDKSIKEVEEGKSTIFTMEQLDKYLQQNFS